jgi:hypothetical protein
MTELSFQTILEAISALGVAGSFVYAALQLRGWRNA